MMNEYFEEVILGERGCFCSMHGLILGGAAWSGKITVQIGLCIPNQIKF
jgi:hypothetical protein